MSANDPKRTPAVRAEFRSPIAGLDIQTLRSIKEQLADQYAIVQMTGDIETDVGALKGTCGGGANLVFEMVGNAKCANGTIAAMRSMARGGRLVLMGSMETELPLNYGDLLLNKWEVIGNFMYQPKAYQVLRSLIRTDRLDRLGVAQDIRARRPSRRDGRGGPDESC